MRNGRDLAALSESSVLKRLMDLLFWRQKKRFERSVVLGGTGREGGMGGEEGGGGEEGEEGRKGEEGRRGRRIGEK